MYSRHVSLVRHRAKEIVELIDDPDRLKAERDKALQNRNKYAGVSSDEARTGFGSSKFAAQASAKASPTGYDGYPGGAGSSSTAYSAPPRRTSETRVSASALPAVVMAAEPVVAAAPAAAPQPNLLDFDFGAQQQAAAPAASGWGAFESSAPAATASTGFGNFASFQAPPSVAAQQQNAFAAPTAAGFTSFQQPQQAAPADAFGGFASFQAAAPVPAPVAAPAANDFGDFGGFASSAPAPTVNTTAAAAPPGWNTAPLSATTTARPSVVAASPHAPKKVEDVLNSNLAALDSLAKFNLPTPKANGPALNQLGSTTAAPAAINTAASNNFGGFTVASAGSANAGFGNFASTGPMSAANVPGGFGAFQSGPGFGAQQQQQQTGSTAGQQAANPWGSVQNNDLLM